MACVDLRPRCLLDQGAVVEVSVAVLPVVEVSVEVLLVAEALVVDVSVVE